MPTLDSVRRSAALQASATRKLLRLGTTPALLGMNASAKGYYRVLWLGTAAREGVLAQLAQGPAPAADLTTRMGMPASAQDGLAAWLDLGVSLGLVSLRRGRYALTRSARALTRPSHDAVAAFYTEMVDLHHGLVSEGPDRLRTERPLAVGDADPELIARSSRIGEPYLASVIEDVVPATGPFRLVEVGCGSAAHIRAAAAHNPQLTALGLELQEGAAELARRNLQEWGLTDRVRVEVGDVRDRLGEGDADLVTLHQNIYYFPGSERVALLRHLGSFLRPGGRVLVTSICRGGGHAAAALDLWCALTDGPDRLPTGEELAGYLRDAGCTDVEDLTLTPDGLFHAAVGTWPGAPASTQVRPPVSV